MRFARKPIVFPVVVTLLALASGYACGDDAPSAVDRTRESTAIPVQSASPTAAPPAVSAVISTPTPTPSVQSPSASPTVLPVSTPTPEFGAARDSEAVQPRDVSRFEFFSGNPGESAYSEEDVSRVEDALEKGLHLAEASPVHLAIRGTARRGSVRCGWRGVARTSEQREEAIRFWLELDDGEALPSATEVEEQLMLGLNRINAAFVETAQAGFRTIARGGTSTDQVFLTCYVDYTTSEYLLGAGHSTLTVAYNGMGEARSYALYKRALEAGEFGDEALMTEEEYDGWLDVLVEAVELFMRGALEGHEGVVFLAPMGAHNAIAVETWQVVDQWDVQTVDGVVNAVRYGAGAGDPEHTQTLSELRTRIRTAVGSSSSGGTGGVSGQVEPESPPSGGVVSGQSDSSSGSGGASGASGQSSSTTSSAPVCPMESSSSASPATVTPTPTPTRIASVSGLRGYYESIGAYCYIGPYPTDTATPTPTASSGGSVVSGQSGSDATETATTTPAVIPTPLPTFVPSQPPAVYAPKPGSLTATASGEDTANLTWTAVTGATGYKVQHRESSDDDSDVGPWKTASSSVTGTSYSVTGLWCGKEHEFRVGAYGNGTTYNGRAGLWTTAVSATMGSCTAQSPRYRAASYSFDVHTAMAVGGVVGEVSAYDVNGDTVTYSITGGNSAGKFAIEGATGEITVAGSLGTVAVGSAYALTVGASDGVSGTTSVTVNVSVVAPTCRSGVAVEDPRSNYWLVHDCEVLLDMRDTLRGTGSLNWSAGIAMRSWDGVSVGWDWTPKRVSVLQLDGRRLTGTIPPEIGQLWGLLVIVSRDNQLRGEIPPELGNLRNLRQIIIKNSRLSGRIPRELENLQNLTILILRRHRLSGEIPPELGNMRNLQLLNLARNRLTGELPQELENLTRLYKVELFDEGDTGNKFVGCIPAGLRNVGKNDAHVSDLSYCNSAPVFGSSEYIFSSVQEDADVGTVVGSVSASDIDEGNTLSYSIVSGNVGGAFMATSTGAIMVASGLDYEKKRRYGLTVVVNDGAGGTATTTASIDVTNVVDVCLEGSAVSDPSTNLGLANDCEVLLAAKDTLRGSRSLNWSMDTPMTSWHGVTVSGTPKRVTVLLLGSSRLTGSIPWELGSLSNLTSLNLKINSLTGVIPSELGSLSNLTSLNLRNNTLTGVIPSELGSLSELTELKLNGNMLTGSIPPELGGLTNLTFFDVGSNKLTGVIPSELGNLSNLDQLWLQENQLSGSLPSELGRLSKLRYLIMWTNGLSGEIPSELGGLPRLESVSFRSNSFTGCVPTEWRIVHWVDFQAGLSYCNSAPVFGSSEYAFSVGEDASVGRAVGTVSASDVDYWDSRTYSIVSGNVGGLFSIAGSTGAITLAGGLDYETRRRYTLTVQARDVQGKTSTTTAVVDVTNVVDVCLEGAAVPNPSSNSGLANDCEVLLVAKDTLRGTGSLNWSTGIAMTSWDGVTVGGTPKRVTELRLRWRSLTGSIPWELGSLSELTVLNLKINALTGVIPPELGSLSKLTGLNLRNNMLTGGIPPELGSLTNVTFFNLAANRLTGGIPPELGNLSSVDQLWLKENPLGGSIPSELGNLSTLTRLEMWKNNLSGSIPSELGQLSNLTRLMIHDNNLSGEIPNELGGLTNLTTLQIFGGNNRFTGCIPAGWKLRAMTVLPTGFAYCHPAPSPSGVEFEDSRVRVGPQTITGATSYEVELSGDGSTRTTSCTGPWWCSFTGRVGQSYTARGRYTKSGTLSEWSTPLTFTFRGFLASDSVTATRSGNSITVRWTPASGGVVSQRVRLLYTTSGCNSGTRSWDGPNHSISDGTTSSHTFTNLDLSTYVCIFPVVYNYYPTGYTLDFAPTILVGNTPTPSIVLGVSWVYVIPHDISGTTSYEAELSGDGSTRTTTCTYTWGCTFTARVGQRYTARVRHSTSPGVFTAWSASKPFTFHGVMPSGSVSATRSGSSVTVNWTTVADGVVSQNVVLTFTRSGCSLRDRIWSGFSQDFADSTTRTHTFTNVDLSEYTCIFPFVINYFASDKTVNTHQFGSGVRLTSSAGASGASGVGGASGQAESPTFDLSRDLEFIHGLEAARQFESVPLFEFDRDSYAFSIAEDADTGAVVGVVRASAPAGSAESYAIAAGNEDGKFAIGTTSGEITVVAGLDYETTTSYTLTVEARDGRDGATTAAVEITVVDVAESSVPGAAPRDLVAEASADSVTLQWVAPEDGGVTGYRVLRRRAQVDDAFVSLAEVVATSTPMYVDTRDVVAGAQYIYRVVAVYDGIDGGDARVSVVIPLLGPRDLVAEASSGSVTLQWSAPEGGAVTEYRVLRRRAQVDDAFVSLAEVVATSTPMYVDTRDVAAGAQYIYRVVTVYDGVAGGDARVSVVIPLLGPRDLVAEASSGSVTLQWSAPEGGAVTEYRVLRRRAQVDDAFVSLAEVVATSTPMYVDTRDVAAGAQYIYRVVAVYDGIDGGDARVAITTPSALAASVVPVVRRRRA